MILITKNNKYKSNNKINLYRENLIKFIIGQKEKIILIGNIDPIDYIVGILFLTETNRYFKQNKINSHGYYLAYTFINLFNKIKLKINKSYKFKLNDINNYILSLSNNIDYINSRIDNNKKINNKINNNLSKFLIEIISIITFIFNYHKNHSNDNNIIDIDLNSNSSSNPTNITNKNKIYQKNKYCNITCYSCSIIILSKFFYLLLLTAKFIGSGIYSEPNLIRLSEYYANIFYTWIISNDLNFLNFNNKNDLTELYENYLNYKNKLNYSLIELDLNSETLDEVINYLDTDIIENLSIKLK